MANFSMSLIPEPVITVHRGWKELQEPLGIYEDVFRLDSHSTSTSEGIVEQDKSTTSSWKKPQSVQEFAFVNGTTPFRNRDPEVRKLVRGHVVKDSTRKKRLQKEKLTGNKKLKPVERQSRHENRGNDSLVSSDRSYVYSDETIETTISKFSSQMASFPSYELDPHPQLSPIIYHITEVGNAMYPHMFSLRFNPISPTAWFDHALRDEALFHALLYTTSSYHGLILGTTESTESIVHFEKSVSLVKERLKVLCDVRMGNAVTVFVEGTARAVSCLAFTEVIRGNFEGWKVHMMGLKQMVEVRGGITKFSIGLQLKIHRADLMGATDYLRPPFFSDSNGLPSLPSRDVHHSAAQTALISFLDTLPISPDLSNSLISMHILSQQISRILSTTTVYPDAQQMAFLERIYSLRYSLLPPAFNAWYLDPGTETLDEVLRIGALLYIQTAPQEFPHATVGPSNLVKKLRELVLSVQMWNEREGVLVMWLLFIGVMSARKGDDKTWFTAQIEKLSGRLGFEEWGDVRGKLEVLWWVGGLHDKRGKEVWGEVEGLRCVMREEQA